MPSRITRRIERELGMPGLVDALSARLPPSDLRSILMEVYLARAASVPEAEIRALVERDPLMAPSAVNARELLAFDYAALEPQRNSVRSTSRRSVRCSGERPRGCSTRPPLLSRASGWQSHKGKPGLRGSNVPHQASRYDEPFLGTKRLNVHLAAR